MKKLFIEAKSSLDIRKAVENSIELLPKKGKIGIVTTAQHKHKLDEIKNIIEKKGLDAIIGGQVLGCNAKNAVSINEDVDVFLYVGSGRFHPIEVQLETGKEVIMANPFTDEARILEKSEVEKLKKQQKGALLRFLSSDKIGIIVSTKPGQEKLKKAFEIKDKIRLKNKECFIFLADTINPSEFENFPFVECWINTACPRFADDKNGVINYEIVEENI